MSSSDSVQIAEACKKEGNAAYAAKQFTEAVRMYTEGIKADVTSYVLYANRSAAYFQLKDYDNALADANLAIQHKPDWLKGYYRKAQVLMAVNRHLDALLVVKQAAKLDSKPDWIRTFFAKCQRAADEEIKATPVASLAHWEELFSLLSDMRLRLATIATFWNECERSTRFLVFEEFLRKVSGEDESRIEALFGEHNMPDLPMDNYMDIHVPPAWLAVFQASSPEDKLATFDAMWRHCKEEERMLIMKDVQVFFTPEGMEPASDSDDSSGDENDEHVAALLDASSPEHHAHILRRFQSASAAEPGDDAEMPEAMPNEAGEAGEAGEAVERG